MPTKTSIALYLLSLIGAESTVLKLAGCLTLKCVLSLELPITEMLIVGSTVTLSWLGYSPLFKPIGAPKNG